jgi:hypothetical protein
LPREIEPGEPSLAEALEDSPFLDVSSPLTAYEWLKIIIMLPVVVVKIVRPRIAFPVSHSPFPRRATCADGSMSSGLMCVCVGGGGGFNEEAPRRGPMRAGAAPVAEGMQKAAGLEHEDGRRVCLRGG